MGWTQRRGGQVAATEDGCLSIAIPRGSVSTAVLAADPTVPGGTSCRARVLLRERLGRLRLWKSLRSRAALQSLWALWLLSLEPVRGLRRIWLCAAASTRSLGHAPGLLPSGCFEPATMESVRWTGFFSSHSPPRHRHIPPCNMPLPLHSQLRQCTRLRVPL